MSMEINAVLAQMRSVRIEAGQDIAPPATPVEGQFNFSEVLQESLQTVSSTQKTAEVMSLNYASGDESISLADTMVAMQKASLSFEAVVQVRNKVLSAYQEVMSMSV
jgi:flagellar hook-basal body complex protein FliE